jgi:hypothetical protein
LSTLTNRPSLPSGPVVRLWRRIETFNDKMQRGTFFFFRHCLAVTLLLFAYACVQTASDERHRLAELATDARQVTGAVSWANYPDRKSHRVGNRTVVYTFTDFAGRSHKGSQSRLFSQHRWTTGEPIVVYYSPRAPTISAVDVGRLDRNAMGLMKLAWIFGAVALVAGVFQIRGHRGRRRPAP